MGHGLVQIPLGRALGVGTVGGHEQRQGRGTARGRASLEARLPVSVTGEDREATPIDVTRTCLAGKDAVWRHGI